MADSTPYRNLQEQEQAFVPSPIWRRDWLVIGLAILALASWHLATLTRWPAPDVDEAWRANRAVALIQAGYPFGTMDQGVFDLFPDYDRFPPVVEIWLTSLPMRVLGPTVLAVRLTSWLFGILLLTVLSATARFLWGSLAGLLAVVVTGLSLPFLVGSHLGRQDIIVAALGYGAVAVYVRVRPSVSLVTSLLLGILGVLAFEIHPNGVIFAGVLFVLYLADAIQGKVRRPFLCFCIGALIGVSAYIAYHVLPNPDTYIATTQLGYGSTHTPPLLSGEVPLMLRGFWDTFMLILGVGRFHAAVGVWCLVIAVRYRRRAMGTWVLVALTLYTMISLLVRSKRYYYGILVTPAFDMLIVGVLAWWLRRLATAIASARQRQIVPSVVAVLVLTVPLLLGSIGNQNLLKHDGMVEHERVMRSIQTSVEDNSVILGSQRYWFGLQSHTYLSWEQIIYFLRTKPDATVSDALQALRPDYLLFDDHFSNFIVDSRDSLGSDPYAEHLTLLSEDVALAIRDRYELIASIPSSQYGTVEIYRKVSASDSSTGLPVK